MSVFSLDRLDDCPKIQFSCVCWYVWRSVLSLPADVLGSGPKVSYRSVNEKGL